MARILAIDYGQKRTGIAVTDPLKIIANSIGTVETSTIWAFLTAYFLKEQVEKVVVGLPMQMNHQPSQSMGLIEEFVDTFRKKFPQIPVELYDERFTSKMAVQAMIDGGVKKKDRRNKGLIDSISATILLQSYMESIKNKPF